VSTPGKRPCSSAATSASSSTSRPCARRTSFARLARRQGIPAIHVLGTNGKGSTAAMCAHALRRGRRVGLYTSPHLHRVGERIRVEGDPDR
jgi:folylpolyglutamate synthase/dihydropteroate synthase